MVRKKRPGKSAKYRLLLVASRTDLPNVSRPVDILLAHQWDETGLNMRQLRPGLLGLSDFRNHIAAALIPSTVWNNPELSSLKRFKGARFFEQLGKTEHQIRDNTWEEKYILKTVAIEECGWTGESLENVTDSCESSALRDLIERQFDHLVHWEKER
ncbi:hypothetical protein HFD88_000142 [Aspergillus terreus]|nr:hypothetical protein HFD88_000142 [Aspergillus terreus]